MTMAKYIFWLVAEVAIFRWLFWALRRKLAHEAAISFGALCGVTLWFEVFTGLLPNRLSLIKTPGWLGDIGSIFLCLGPLLAIISILTLRRRGKPPSGWENTTCLVETGIYRWVRHPLYLSGLLLITGMLLRRMNWATLALSILSAPGIILAAWFEDRYNAEKFGQTYRHYQDRSKLLIPFLF